MKRNLLATAVAAMVAIGAGQSAHADPIVDGIDIPAGAVFNALNIQEQLVSSVGQTLEGVGIVGTISGSSVGSPTYTYGENGKYLTFGFSGFVVSAIQAPTATTAGYVDFTGGTVTFAVNSTAPNLTTGNQTTDFLNATTGNISSDFLTLTPETFFSSLSLTNVDLEATIPANTTLTSFSNAFGSGFFDATGGDAASVFNTCSFTSPTTTGGTCPPTLVDMTFTESFNSGVSGDFPVSGTGSLKAESVPEPASLALLGVGLVCLGIGRRLRRKSTSDAVG